MITERIEDGIGIITVETEQEFLEAFDRMEANPDHIEVEAPQHLLEKCGIFDSAEEHGIEPDDRGLPAEAYERGRWN